MSGGGGEQKESMSEAINARVGLANKRRFNQKFDSQNLAELKDAQTDTTKKLLRGAAAADAMQGLTSNMQFNPADAGMNPASMAQAYTGQLAKATQAAAQSQAQREAAAIGVAQGQQADNSQAMGLLANLGSSEALQKARNEQLESAAKMQTIGRVATAGMDKAFGGGDKNNAWTKFREGLSIASEY